MTQDVEYQLEVMRPGRDFTLYRGRKHGVPPVLAFGVNRHSPARQSADRLAHEYTLAPDLDPAWSARPLALTRHEGRPMLLLEDHGGEPLDLVLARERSTPLDLAAFLKLAADIAAALGKVHAKGIIHKDINPANVLINDAGRSASRDSASRRGSDANVRNPARPSSSPGRSRTWRRSRRGG